MITLIGGLIIAAAIFALCLPSLSDRCRMFEVDDD